jgi:hypothetical protein
MSHVIARKVQDARATTPVSESWTLNVSGYVDNSVNFVNLSLVSKT